MRFCAACCLLIMFYLSYYILPAIFRNILYKVHSGTRALVCLIFTNNLILIHFKCIFAQRSMEQRGTARQQCKQLKIIQTHRTCEQVSFEHITSILSIQLNYRKSQHFFIFSNEMKNAKNGPIRRHILCHYNHYWRLKFGELSPELRIKSNKIEKKKKYFDLFIQ